MTLRISATRCLYLFTIVCSIFLTIQQLRIIVIPSLNNVSLEGILLDDHPLLGKRSFQKFRRDKRNDDNNDDNDDDDNNKNNHIKFPQKKPRANKQRTGTSTIKTDHDDNNLSNGLKENTIKEMLQQLQSDNRLLPLKRLWFCPAAKTTTTTTTKARLLFVHVFKTAGSTIRNALKRYASKCHKGFSEVVKCRGLQFASTVAGPYDPQLNRSISTWTPALASWPSTSLSTIYGDNNNNNNIITYKNSGSIPLPAIIPDQNTHPFLSTVFNDKENPNEYWRGSRVQNYETCRIKSSIYRNGSSIQEYAKHEKEQMFTSRSLDRTGMDILAGHMALGCDDGWVDYLHQLQEQSNVNHNDDNSRVVVEPTQYITFFRHPMAKLVSARMYIQRKWEDKQRKLSQKDRMNTIDQVIDMVVMYVEDQLHNKKQYENGYSAYLVTPLQAMIGYDNIDHPSMFPGIGDIGFLYEAASKTEGSDNAKTTLQILSNMKHFKSRIMFGIVEEMSQSMELVHYLLVDSSFKDNASTNGRTIFEFQRKTFQETKDWLKSITPSPPQATRNITSTKHVDSVAPKNSSTTTKIVPTEAQSNRKIHNQSKLSTSEIVKALQANETARVMLEEYLKYEYPIYNLAHYYHNQQYAWLLSQNHDLSQ